MNNEEKVVFWGVDTWNRPCFRSVENPKAFYGSVDTLFSFEAEEGEVLSRINKGELLYFGRGFGCEPVGTKPERNLVIVKGEEANL